MFEMRDALKLRYSLAPYIYNAARENYDTGVAMTRPLYYEYPSLEEAYSHPEQFFSDLTLLPRPWVILSIPYQVLQSVRSGFRKGGGMIMHQEK